MASNSIKKIQQALQLKGFDPGEIDGVWGRNSIRAVKQFQAEKGLEVDGIVGPNTRAALFGETATADAAANMLASSTIMLPWFEEAKHLIGLSQMDDGDNPIIMDWADDLDIHYPNDEVPWCGLFVAHCINSTLPDEAIPNNPLGARQWQRFGVETTPKIGAVMVFWRKSKTSVFGHVGFYAGENENKNAYQILGGNQSDKVSLAWVSKDRFLGARWPKSATSLASATVFKEPDEGLSEDEG